jgi:hypothetical protein
MTLITNLFQAQLKVCVLASRLSLVALMFDAMTVPMRFELQGVCHPGKFRQMVDNCYRQISARRRITKIRTFSLLPVPVRPNKNTAS